MAQCCGELTPTAVGWWVSLSRYLSLSAYFRVENYSEYYTANELVSVEINYYDSFSSRLVKALSGIPGNYHNGLHIKRVDKKNIMDRGISIK
jgi:hypothetical protein